MSTEQQPHSTIEVVKKCPKCGEEYAQSFTPRAAAEWAEVEKAVGEDKPCPRCAYSFSFAGIKNMIEPGDPTNIIYGKHAIERLVATEEDFKEWLAGNKYNDGRYLLDYCVCSQYPSNCRFHTDKSVTDGPHNVLPSFSIVSRET